MTAHPIDMLKSARRKISPKNSSQPASAGVIVKFGSTRILARSTNKIESKLLGSRGYDLSNFEVVNSVVREGNVCFDIGANIGVYSAVMSRLVGQSGHVHAFEPVKHVRRRLRLNLALNGSRNVSVNGFALGHEAGQLEMFQVKEGLFRGGTSTFLHNDNVQEMGVESFDKELVDIITLDEYVARNKVPAIDFIKLDVEGFEINVLRGGHASLEKFKPTILFEHDQDRLIDLGISEDVIGTLFAKIGYACYEIDWVDGAASLIPYFFDRRLRSNNLIALHIGE